MISVFHRVSVGASLSLFHCTPVFYRTCMFFFILSFTFYKSWLYVAQSRINTALWSDELRGAIKKKLNMKSDLCVCVYFLFLGY